jgi:hypothetical protein
MRALILNCTLKASPEQSNTAALLNVVAAAMRQDEVDVDVVRLVDHDVQPGVTNDEGDGDAWPTILALLRDAEILVIATPTWLGQPSSIAEVAQSLIDIGSTVPGQAWTSWNIGPAPGPSYLETDHKHDWSERTGRTAAANLVAVARALAERPMPAPAE